MGELPNCLPMPPTDKLRVKVPMRKENAMDATLYVLLMIVLRLGVPVGVLLGLGELIKRRNAKYWLKG